MVEVPKEEKVYTTIYDNFKGVDFTNDASNVWRHRSPSGKNMLPDLDGRPYKRKGWEIKITADEFRRAAGVTGVDVVPVKVHYFEIGGYDYLMFFNNLGVFTYTTIESESDEQEKQSALWLNDKYIDLSGELQTFDSITGGVQPDPQRAFFFEGGGTAGFYMFAGLKLFRFSGEYDTTHAGRFFYEVDPYTPLILTGCDPNGVGTDLENINMLTPKRIVQYSGDGVENEGVITGSTSFTVPGGFSGTPLVEIRDDTGNWVTATGYTAENGKIDFATAPVPVIAGEDQIRVTYVPDGVNATVTEKEITRADKTFFVQRVITQSRTKKDKKAKDSTATAWATESTEWSTGGTSFDISNVKINQTTKEKYCIFQCRNESNQDWQTMDEQYYDKNYDAYKNTVTMTAKAELFSSSIPASSTSSTTGTPSAWKKSGSKYKQTRTVTEYRYYRVRVKYTSYQYTAGTAGESESKTAFTQCSRALVYGNGLINQVFLASTPYSEYNTRVWYSGATDPTYFPDLNYFEVGATDKPIMGLMKVGEYLGIIKQGDNIDTAIYLAYPTSFDESTVYAVKQNINGIGAVSNGAFNTLNEEPLFLSKVGVMGIEVSSEETDRMLRNRSYFINKKLCSEDNLSSAISFVHDGMYYLAINGHCYVLDGSQKSSWANTKTNLQYECYYLENIPAQCFAKYNEELWFTDFLGNVCRFKTDHDSFPYRDAYTIGEEIPDNGVAIDAVWSTIADDDGAVHYFKNLQKKGVVISLLPQSDSGVDVYVKADDNEPILVGTTDAKDYTLPFDFYTRKKVKKYKRLQFICRNNTLDDAFGIDQIIKSYTVGSYSKNRG